MMQLESKQDLDQMEYNPDVTDATREFKLKVNDGSLIAKASSFTRSAYENLVKEPMTAFALTSFDMVSKSESSLLSVGLVWV